MLPVVAGGILASAGDTEKIGHRCRWQEMMPVSILAFQRPGALSGTRVNGGAEEHA
ncbi:hypothetical protein [Burkholderia sp. BCC0405]|uniref:hypothetical protein n=1 Tax=Burkholderia sp. BCC0405 TaxID=2676298 RepID=UPI00158835CE|nr:hypothetical protein [Burkholderia sp. BCC0405]